MNATNNKHTLQLLNELKALKNQQRQLQEQQQSLPKRRKSVQRENPPKNVLLSGTSQKRKNPLRSSQSTNRLLNNAAPDDNYFQRQGSANVLLQQRDSHQNVLLSRAEQQQRNVPPANNVRASATRNNTPGQAPSGTAKRARDRPAQQQQESAPRRPSTSELRRGSLSRAASRQRHLLMKDEAAAAPPQPQQHPLRRSSSNQKMRSSTQNRASSAKKTAPAPQPPPEATSGSHYLNYLKTYVPSTQPPLTSTQSSSSKHKRQPSFSIEEKANEIIRTTDERILLENGIEISPIKKRNNAVIAANSRKRSSTTSLNHNGTDTDQYAASSSSRPLSRTSSATQQYYDQPHFGAYSSSPSDDIPTPTGHNFESKFSQLEAQEQQLEDEINALDARLANKSSFVSSSVKLKKLQRPRSAFVLSATQRKKSTPDTYLNEIEETNEKYKHIPLDIDLQIERHRQRLKNAGIRRRHSAVLRSRSVDRSASRNRSVNRSAMSARLLELSKPRIRQNEWEQSTADDATNVSQHKKRYRSRERRSQSVPRLRPCSNTKLFGSPKYYEENHNKSHHSQNIPTIDAEANEAKHRKTPQVSVHLKHLLIGAAEIERVQSDIRSYEEQRKQHGFLESVDGGAGAGRHSLNVRYSTSQRPASPTFSHNSRYAVGGSAYSGTIRDDVSVGRSVTSHHQRPLSAPPRQVEEEQSQGYRASLGAQDTAQDDIRRHSASGAVRSQPAEAKSTFQQLVEEKLMILQQTMKNLSRTETKYHKSVDKMTNNLNNSMRQSISSTGSYDFSRAREQNLFSASLDNREGTLTIPARFSMESRQRERIQSQNQIPEDEEQDSSSSGDASDYSQQGNRYSTAQRPSSAVPHQQRPSSASHRPQQQYDENPLLRRQKVQEDRYNPLLSPNPDDLAPPYDEQPRMIQRNTPLFANAPQNAKSNSARTSLTPPRYLNAPRDTRPQQAAENATTGGFSVASLMLNREREMQQRDDLDESFNTRFNKLRSKISVDERM